MVVESDLDAVAEKVEALGLVPDLREHLREAFPEMNITVCSDDDVMNRKPYKEFKTWNMYLVGGGEGCVSLTDFPGSATGCVIAEIEEDW